MKGTETAKEFEARTRSTPQQYRQSIGKKFVLPSGWKHDKGSQIQAPISWKGDYVVSHRGDESGKGHNVSFRPTGQHHHVGSYPTAQAAFQAADQHAASQKCVTS